MKKSMTTLGATVLMLFAATSVGASAASAHNTDSPSGNGAGKTVTLTATLSQLNNSGVSGMATAVVRHKKIKSINVQAMRLTPDAPHAQLVHYPMNHFGCFSPKHIDRVAGDQIKFLRRHV